MFLELESTRHNLDRPTINWSIPSRLEAKDKVTGVFMVEGEGIYTLLWCSLGIRDEELLGILAVLVVSELAMRGHFIHLPSHSLDMFDNQLIQIGI